MGNTTTKKRHTWAASNYQEIADFFGVSIDTVKRWAGQGMPKNYRLDKIAQWLRNDGPWRPRNAPGVHDDPMLADGDSPALERFRAARAEQEELKLAEQKRQLVRRERIHGDLGRFASIIRGAGESLQREFGQDAHRILDDALEDALQIVGDLASDDCDVDDRSAD